MTKETKTVWVTKLALTSGITMHTAELVDSGTVKILNARFPTYYHGKEWHLSYEAAVVEAEAMRLKKISAMEKRLAKLKNLRFSSTPALNLIPKKETTDA